MKFESKFRAIFSNSFLEFCRHGSRSVKSLRSNLTVKGLAHASSEPLCPLRALSISAVSMSRLVIFGLISSALSEPRANSVVFELGPAPSSPSSGQWPAPPSPSLGQLRLQGRLRDLEFWPASPSPGHFQIHRLRALTSFSVSETFPSPLSSTGHFHSEPPPASSSPSPGRAPPSPSSGQLRRLRAPEELRRLRAPG